MSKEKNVWIVIIDSPVIFSSIIFETEKEARDFVDFSCSDKYHSRKDIRSIEIYESTLILKKDVNKDIPKNSRYINI